jgi:DnaJ-class molecular chaperone
MICRICHGTGWRRDRRCPDCHGTGSLNGPTALTLELQEEDRRADRRELERQAVDLED